MSKPVLFRLDLLITKDKSTGDRAQVPAAGARVDFYGQGATVSMAVTIPVTTPTTVDVYDPGDLKDGSTLQVTPGGPALTISSVSQSPAFPEATQITVVNNTGASVALSVGDRLILTSDRPELFSDPLGATTAIGNFLIADENGRVVGYIDRRRFDYTVSEQVLVLASSSTTLATGDVLSWTHTDTSTLGKRFVLVGISWQGQTGEESIAAVTYGGQTMTLVGVASLTAVYRLANPPTGPQTVVVTFSSTSPPAQVSAVGGAVTFSGVDPFAPMGTAAAASGSSTTPNVNVTSTFADGAVFDTVGAGNTTTATVGSGQTQRWNAISGGFPTRGAGSTEPGTGSAVTMSWTLGTSRPWGIVAVALRPGVRLHIDAVGATTPSTSTLNVRDFGGIQQAIDALPFGLGGTLYAPAGTYNVSTITIPENKPVHLIGDGRDRTIIFCEDPEQDILLIEASNTTIENLTIKGPYLVPPDPPGSAGRGVVIGKPGSPTDILRRVSIIGCRIVDTASWALLIRGTQDSPIDAERLLIWGNFEGTDFQHNRTSGLVEVHHGNNGNLFKNCSFTQFNGYGLNAFGVSSLSLQSCTFEDKLDDIVSYVTLDFSNNVLLDSCWFEQHFSTDLTNPFVLVGVANVGGACHEVAINNCRFVRNTGNLPRFIKVDKDSKGVSIVNPTCHMVQTPELFANRVSELDNNKKDINVVGESEVFLSGGIITSDGSTTPAIVVAPATGVVTAGLGPRMAPPGITETLRDSSVSLARDKKPGDMIYNTNAKRLQEWSGVDWLPVGVTPSGSGDNVTGTVYGGTGLARVSAYLTRAGAGTVELKIEWSDSVGARSSTIAIAPSPGSDFAQGQLVVHSIGTVTYRVLNPSLIPWQVTISAEQI